MNIQKFLVGGIIGGIAHFFLGWLVWGILLKNFMQEHSNPTAAVIFRGESMIWWALIVGSIAMGFLVCYILMKASVSSAASGAATAAVVGFLMAVGIDCIMYAQMKIFGTTGMAADIVAATVVMGIIGAVVGWYLSRSNKAS